MQGVGLPRIALHWKKVLPAAYEWALRHPQSEFVYT